MPRVSESQLPSTKTLMTKRWCRSQTFAAESVEPLPGQKLWLPVLQQKLQLLVAELQMGWMTKTSAATPTIGEKHQRPATGTATRRYMNGMPFFQAAPGLLRPTSRQRAQPLPHRVPKPGIPSATGQARDENAAGVWTAVRCPPSVCVKRRASGSSGTNRVWWWRNGAVQPSRNRS